MIGLEVKELFIALFLFFFFLIAIKVRQHF